MFKKRKNNNNLYAGDIWNLDIQIIRHTNYRLWNKITQ